MKNPNQNQGSQNLGNQKNTQGSQGKKGSDGQVNDAGTRYGKSSLGNTDIEKGSKKVQTDDDIDDIDASDDEDDVY